MSFIQVIGVFKVAVKGELVNKNYSLKKLLLKGKHYFECKMAVLTTQLYSLVYHQPGHLEDQTKTKTLEMISTLD